LPAPEGLARSNTWPQSSEGWGGENAATLAKEWRARSERSGHLGAGGNEIRAAYVAVDAASMPSVASISMPPAGQDVRGSPRRRRSTATALTSGRARLRSRPARSDRPGAGQRAIEIADRANDHDLRGVFSLSALGTRKIATGAADDASPSEEGAVPVRRSNGERPPNPAGYTPADESLAAT